MQWLQRTRLRPWCTNSIVNSGSLRHARTNVLTPLSSAWRWQLDYVPTSCDAGEGEVMTGLLGNPIVRAVSWLGARWTKVTASQSVVHLDASRPSWCSIRHRCERLIAALPIPELFDVSTFLGRLARRRGRRIELIPATLPATLPHGMLISTDNVDYIFHAADATPLHAQHIAMHEVSHLLLDHATGNDAPGLRQDRPDLVEQDAVRSLLPDLSPALLRRILGRAS